MRLKKITTLAFAAVVALVLSGNTARAQTHTSKPFAGVKVNGGTVTHSIDNGKHVLTLSEDFQTPDTPDPHWQVVDTNGRVFLLQRLKAKGAIAGLAGDRFNRSITLPSYIQDVAKVQIYCAWAEALLGETTFDAKITTVAAK